MFFMVTYNIDDRFCPCGNKWIFIPASLSFGDYYYCEKCDKIFVPTVEERTKEWFEKNYRTDRLCELKNLARIVEARAKVTKDDLKRLGYI
jgi:hypothetical protein